jgi:ketosteroid isomerase-like protein
MLFALSLPVFSADFRTELLEADRAFDRDTAARGLDGWMAWFAEDARLNTAQGEINGKAAVRKYYSGMFARREFSIRWQPFFAGASSDGTLGYTMGTAVISYRDDQGQIQKRDGRYLTVWRRQAGGRWLAVTDMGN